MVPLQIPGGAEFVIAVLVVLVPVALLYVGYKLLGSVQAFREGMADR